MHLPARADQRTGLRCAWRGSSMLVLGPDGWCGDHPLSGWFFRQTRYLRELRLLLAGAPPHLCSIAEVSPATLELTFIHPEVRAGGGGGSGSGGDDAGGGLLFRNFDVRVRCTVRPAFLDIVVTLASRWQDDVVLDAVWRLGTDFASVDDAQFDRATSHVVEPVPFDAGVVLDCRDCGLPVSSRIEATGAQWDWRDGSLSARIRPRRQEPIEFALRVHADDAADPIDEDGARRREARLDAWTTSLVELHAPAETPLVDFANRASIDIGAAALLEGPEDEWLTPGAGIPLYQALWARDALTTAWQAGLLDRGAMLADVLACMDRLQGAVVDPDRDEEPGRILNQAKRDLDSRLGRSGLFRYYADVASPFMFIIGLGYHFVLTGDREHLAAHYNAALRVLEWADAYGDRDGDGYIEYLTHAPHGPRHQGWKDSENAVVDEHGEQIAPPIAACEIQGYRYVALQYMAGLSLALGERARGFALWRQAARLKRRFNRDFWLDDEGYIAFGLDAQKRPIRVLTSNAAHCLPTGIVDRRNVARLVRRIFEPDLFSGWGIRTLTTRNPAYNPLDYHLGSVWPVENATILFGLRRYGFDDRVIQLARALYDLAALWPSGRTPECIGGYDRDELAHPGAYPRANRPQTWNQSVWPILVQCLLGLVPFAPVHTLLVDPILPGWLPELTVKRLRVGDAMATLRFHRDAHGASHVDVVERTGGLRVIRQPWIESFSAGGRERLLGIFDSVTLQGGHRAEAAD